MTKETVRGGDTIDVANKKANCRQRQDKKRVGKGVKVGISRSNYG